ncbi:hypothetical protein DAPPUDRAFT_239606 [Daphnia pulex]|uniref:Uncharacterized protein n=1 Tax=Daphnia pulex TaxID=6669 RepID=E9G9N8_DAPPU|nr:hypothetical protein DAPPUDRAFT_239606 [Daphnia pulex]|eukprot:EFX83598.1 hypothetical protein DAPPUDRAFT_239606 [Daphnia pulex]
MVLRKPVILIINQREVDADEHVGDNPAAANQRAADARAAQKRVVIVADQQVANILRTTPETMLAEL